MGKAWRSKVTICWPLRDLNEQEVNAREQRFEIKALGDFSYKNAINHSQ